MKLEDYDEYAPKAAASAAHTVSPAAAQRLAQARAESRRLRGQSEMKGHEDER